MAGRDGKIPLHYVRRNFSLVTTSKLRKAQLTRSRSAWEFAKLPFRFAKPRFLRLGGRGGTAYRLLIGVIRAAAARPRRGERQEKFFAQLSAKESWRGVERSSTALHSVSGIWFALPQSPKGDMSRLPLRSAMDGRHRRPSPPQRGGLPPSLREVSSRSDDGGSVILSRSYSYLSYRLFAPATAVGHGEGPAHT